MTNLEITLLVITVIGVLWQAFILATALAILASGRGARFGILPGLVAVVTGTWLAFLVL